MELKPLQTFKTLAEELHFTRTADRLNYAQSSVTAQIQGLEAEFGVRLFERIGKRVHLTGAGERLLHYANDILRLAEEARTAVPGNLEPRGPLTIGAVESLCTYRLTPILAEYRSRFPQVELVFRTGICVDLRKEVAQGNLDVAFTLEETGTDDRLVFEILLEERMLVLAQPGHPLTRMSIVHASDLEGETILVTEPGCSYRSMFEQSLAAAGLQNPKIEFASIEAIKQCVISGLGITLLPNMAVVQEIQQGQLSPLSWSDPGFPVVTQMCWHKDKWMSPALQAFIDVARRFLREGANAAGGVSQRRKVAAPRNNPPISQNRRRTGGASSATE
ncbi:MAG: LysR family transcriptional regulator [Bacilli bacterium]